MVNFIEKYFISDLSLCDELIEYHKNSNFKSKGRITSKDGKGNIDPSKKDSTDVLLEDKELKIKLSKVLQESLNKYIEEYKFCNKYASFGIAEGVNVQHYLPNEGYHEWHCERTNANYPSTTRHLVFMMYLNDVDDGGETEFYYQKIKIKPQKGKMIIWAADWTHTHRGITSPTQEKYIITGWFNYLN